MERIAFRMKLFPGFAAEYKKRHDEIWPEISAALKAKRINEYSIFLDETTNYLFATLRVHDAGLLKADTHDPVMQKWYNYMSDIMESNEDNSPVMLPLTEVFYLK